MDTRIVTVLADVVQTTAAVKCLDYNKTTLLHNMLLTITLPLYTHTHTHGCFCFATIRNLIKMLKMLQ